MRTLSVALGDYPHVRSLLAGEVTVDGYSLEPIEVRPIISAYRRMIRDLEFDVCELAPVTYVMALATGLPIAAIPVFLNRRFHHGDLQCGSDSGIAVPADLEGKRVGVRAYSVSTGVWGRGVLQEEYGVDIDSITWVVDDDDHVGGHTPSNVERVEDERSLGALLSAAEIDAAFTGNAGTGRAGAPRAGWTAASPAINGVNGTPYPLFAEADVLARDWYLRTGIYPLHSVIVIRKGLVDADPELPTTLYRAFAESKRRQTAVDPKWMAQPHLARQAREIIGGDPIPYGHDVNEPTLQALVRFSRDQHLLDSEAELEMFAAGNYPAS